MHCTLATLYLQTGQSYVFSTEVTTPVGQFDIIIINLYYKLLTLDGIIATLKEEGLKKTLLALPWKLQTQEVPNNSVNVLTGRKCRENCKLCWRVPGSRSAERAAVPGRVDGGVGQT